MANKKKMIFNLTFLALVFGLTIYGVFHGEDLDSMISLIQQINPWYLAAGIFCVVLFIWGESVIIHYLMNTLSIRTKKRTCFLYSCVGFFFSGITPAAGGGQPAQIYYMNKNKIPVPVSTLVLMIVTITYKSVLVFTGLFLALFQRGFIHKYLGGILPVFYLGVILNVFCCIAMLILVFHPLLARKIMTTGLNLLVKLHILKDKPSRMERLLASMDQYHDTAAYLKKHIPVIIHVTLLTFLQRYALFLVTYIVYRAFGLSGTSLYDILLLQAVISVSADMLPLPGGMGISEKLFTIIFAPVFGPAHLLTGLVLSRGIAYYAQLLISAAMTVVTHLLLTKNITKKRKTTL